MKQTLRTISRASRLALLQVEELRRLLRDAGIEARLELVSTPSYGDRHKEVSLMSPDVPGDFFTRELDAALLSGTADVAVHSAKDLPYPLPAGIEVVALTAAFDRTDSLVARHGYTLATLPSGSRVGTSSAQRKAELLALRQDVEVVPVRGTIEERVAQVQEGRIDALIVASCALQRLSLAHLATERLPFATHPLQGSLAVTAAKARAQELRRMLEKIDVRQSYRKVLLVGFGPGDPDLITVKGQKALQEAGAIYYDDLTNEAFLQRFSGRKEYVGKRSGRHSHAQDEINEKVYRAAIAPLLPSEEGNPRPVVRLKGGDPMVFAHGREEVDYLRSRMVEVEVVPGVSSAIALSSLMQLPLTHRGVARSVAFALGHADKPLQVEADTLVYYMGGERISTIARELLSRGKSPETPVALVSNVSLTQQKAVFSTLGELRYAIYRERPLLIVVGQTVRFVWQEVRQKVLYTGTRLPQHMTPNEEYTLSPLIKIEKNNVEQVSTEGYDWVIFTSRNGVAHYEQPISGVKVASVGPVTSAALRAKGVEVDFESPTLSAEGLTDYFRTLPHCRILIPRSARGVTSLVEGLSGHSVTDLHIYTSVTDTEAERHDLRQYDKIVFTSPSTVTAFFEIYGNVDLTDKLLIAIGQTTLAALETYL